MNKVLLTSRLTRDFEMRALASDKHVIQLGCPVREPVLNGSDEPADLFGRPARSTRERSV